MRDSKLLMAAALAVGDVREAGPVLILDAEERRVVEGFGQMFRWNPPPGPLAPIDEIVIGEPPRFAPATH